MSFIPSRDVFDMTEVALEELGALYDFIEDDYIRDWVKDEYGPDWTPEMVEKEKGPGSLPYSIGGWDMLVYLYGHLKLRGF
jgi:hypothetical protein